LEHDYAHLIASYTKLSDERFDRLVDRYAANLASNPTLTQAMQMRLNGLNDETVFQVLASNPMIEISILDQLFESGRFAVQLASNPSLSPDKLESLGSNANADILSALASNISTPIEILYQLSLDQRFERSVKTNPTFGKHIQTHNIGWS
jgi:hypothetical protein